MAERSRRSATAIVEYALVAVLAKLLDRFPESMAYAIGSRMGRLAWRLDRRHRTIASENLAAAFPGAYGPEDLERVVRAVFETLGRTAVDVARSRRLFRPGDGATFEVEGYDRLREARARGKGVLGLTAHFGPWEILPLWHALRCGPCHIVVRPLDNPYLDDLFTSWRERGGNRVIRKRNAVQAILQALRQGETVGILIDQHIDERDGVVVPFFGRPASTTLAPALIALRSGAVVLPVGIAHGAGRRQYRIRWGEEIVLRRSGDLKADVVENTARFNAALESMIRERPEQWFWVHRRWKTRQPLDTRLRAPETSAGRR